MLMYRLGVLTALILTLAASFAHAEGPVPAATQKLLETVVNEFVEITPGKAKYPASFEMGSKDGQPTEQPVHKVTFNYQFSIAKYEVPQNLFEAVTGQNPSRWKGPRNSAEMMTWKEANEFCKKLTDLLQQSHLLRQDEIIRLPTEAEWEYCCRAGTKTAYSFGDQARKPEDEGNEASILDNYAWHTGNAAGNDPPVGALKPNSWGLYDMHGYLSEFCADSWRPNYTDAPTDGSAVVTDNPTQIVIRGGSWKDAWPKLRSSAREGFALDGKSDAVGFRCVKVKKQ
jgi:formylglycine-generating enzyme required for sulfatase activity